MPLSLPTEQPAAPGVGVKIEANPPTANVRWLHTPDLDQKLQIFEYTNHLLIVPNVAGEFFVGADTPEDSPVWCKIVVGKTKSAWRLPAIPALPWGSIGYWAAILVFAVAVFFAGRHLPGPSPVDPPAPNPPGPVDPPAPPKPAPIPALGTRALIVYESADLKSLPPAQVALLKSQALADALNAACTLGLDGKTHEWRIWDKDTDMTGVPKLWRDAMARPRTSLPWLIVSDGIGGYEGPLPLSLADTVAILKKWSGK